MKPRFRIPLLAKMLGWLLLHMLLLTLLFGGFVAWQLRLGLDSLLSGSTGERLRSFGEVIARDLREAGPAAHGLVLDAEAAAPRRATGACGGRRKGGWPARSSHFAGKSQAAPR
jgi:hypothetical protein